MTYMLRDNNKGDKKPEVGFGEKTDEGYKYRTKINFKEDLSSQIAKLIQEKKAKDELESYIVRIRKIVARFKRKEKNLNYYSAIGGALSFLRNDNFKNIKPYSVFRRLAAEIPDILPNIDERRMADHLMMMYRISGLDSDILNQATWEQWYEISKFKGVITNRAILRKAITESKNSSGPDLRAKIQSLLKPLPPK